MTRQYAGICPCCRSKVYMELEGYTTYCNPKIEGLYEEEVEGAKVFVLKCENCGPLAWDSVNPKREWVKDMDFTEFVKIAYKTACLELNQNGIMRDYKQYILYCTSNNLIPKRLIYWLRDSEYNYYNNIHFMHYPIVKAMVDDLVAEGTTNEEAQLS